jgi:hypothetical protein
MDEQKRASNLDDLAADASRRRDEFLTDAGRSFVQFLDANKARLRDLGGLVLIDDEPDYLFVSEEGKFRSRTRYQDDDGQWQSETEDVESGADLVEIFNPADLYAAFVDAAEDEARPEEREDEAAEDEADEALDDEALDDDLEDDDAPGLDDEWVTPVPAPATREEAARQLYDLALTFQERSQLREGKLLDDFQLASGNLAGMLGDNKVADEEDERLWYRASGAFEGEVVPEEDENGEPIWQSLTSPDEMVQFYDPTDLFGDLAEALAEEHPHVAPELEGDAGDGASDED